MPSMPCHQCGEVRACAMHLDERNGNRPIYLCGKCARELGYAGTREKEDAR